MGAIQNEEVLCYNLFWKKAKEEEKMAFDFSYYSPTKVCFGRKTKEKVGKLVKEFGGKREKRN